MQFCGMLSIYPCLNVLEVWYLGMDQSSVKDVLSLRAGPVTSLLQLFILLLGEEESHQ